LAYFPEIEFRNFAENRFYFELREICRSKKVDNVREVPPYKWAKVHLLRITFTTFFGTLKKDPRQSWPPIESVNSQK